MLSDIPLDRLATATEIGAAVLFLSSPGAAMRPTAEDSCRADLDRLPPSEQRQRRAAEDFEVFIRTLSPVARRITPWLREVGLGVENLRLSHHGAGASFRVGAPTDHLKRLLGYINAARNSGQSSPQELIRPSGVGWPKAASRMKDESLEEIAREWYVRCVTFSRNCRLRRGRPRGTISLANRSPTESGSGLRRSGDRNTAIPAPSCATRKHRRVADRPRSSVFPQCSASQVRDPH